MKRDMDHLNLQDAFAPIPEDCRAALMHAARSVEEEKNVKHLSFRTALIAAVLVLTLSAAAVAAANPGLREWLAEAVGAKLTRNAQQAIESTEKKHCTVGPVSFTVQEMLADGRLAYLTATAYAADGVITPYGCAEDRIGSRLAEHWQHPGIRPETTYAEAASLLHQPLYMVDARMEPADYSVVAVEMMDAMPTEDGSLLLIDMLYTNDLKPTLLSVALSLRVDAVDPDTLDTIPGQSWSARLPQTLPISGVLAKKTYSTQGRLFGFLDVTRVEAELTCAGAYLTVCGTPDPQASPDRYHSVSRTALRDGSGRALPEGISMTTELMNEAGLDLGLVDGVVQELRCRALFSLDELPELLLISDGDTTLTAR